MRKFAFFSIVALLFFGLTACGSETQDDSDANADGTITNTDGSTTDPAGEVVNNTNNNVTTISSLPNTTVEFDAIKHDFGDIIEGEVVSHQFSFINTGENPLKIENVKPSCGCTTPDWTKEEVAPGGEGFIKVEFDSKGKSGIQNKTVTVTLNTEARTQVISFSGEVNKPE